MFKRLHLLLISILLSTPFFLNFNDFYRLNFSRTVDEQINYIISMPISFFYFSFIIGYSIFYINLKIKIKDNFLAALFLISSTLWVLNILFGVALKSSMLSLMIWFFVIALNLIFKDVAFKNYIYVIKAIMNLNIVFGLTAVVVHSASGGISYLGEIIPGYFAIYNYEQYYVLLGVFCYGLYFNYFKNKLWNLMYFMSLSIIAINSENITAVILLFSFILVGIFTSIVKNVEINYVGYLKYSWIILLLALSIAFPIISWLVFTCCVDVNPNDHIGGFLQRVVIHYKILENISFENIILPISLSDFYGVVYKEPHHQILNYWFYGGLFQAVVTVLIISKMLLKINGHDFLIFSMFYFILSSVLEAFTHPFITIPFFFLLCWRVQITQCMPRFTGVWTGSAKTLTSNYGLIHKSSLRVTRLG